MVELDNQFGIEEMADFLQCFYIDKVLAVQAEEVIRVHLLLQVLNGGGQFVGIPKGSRHPCAFVFFVKLQDVADGQ